MAYEFNFIDKVDALRNNYREGLLTYKEYLDAMLKLCTLEIIAYTPR